MSSPEMLKRWSTELADGLLDQGISVDPLAQQQAITFLALLMKWNRAFNLTAVRDPKEVVSRQLLDSYAILGLLRGERILDVGTGPGLPGIPLAIARPALEFTLLDANGKKTRFVQQSVNELGLKNVSVVRGRVEAYISERPFDTVTARAFADLLTMQQLTAHLLAPGGQLLAMKGTVPGEEIAILEQQGYRAEAVSLRVPGTKGQRHAIIIRQPE